MALVATPVSVRGVRRHSIGPMLVEYGTYTAAIADVAGTITAASIAEVDFIVTTSGVILNAVPTYAANVVTLSFIAPTVAVAGTYMLFGR